MAGLEIDQEFLEKFSLGDIAPLPACQRLADQMHAELHSGSGVVWLQGFPAPLFSVIQMKFFYLVLGAAMGRPMDNYGRLYDVRDYGGSYTTERIPVSQTHAATGFHTDSSARNTMPDVVALLCVQPAEQGGESLIVSGARVHEELRNNNPTALTTLYREFIRDVVTPGAGKSSQALLNNRFPVFSQGLYSPQISFRYMRYWIEKGHTRANMDLASEQLEVLDALDQLLESPRFALNFKLEAGDQLWVNNHVVAHNRTEFVDDPRQPRHFVRMWIATS
ncbi:MAG: TauD/TfdA family dioxygenase [Planctomycetaceae bacterium]